MAITQTEKSVSKSISKPAVRPIKWKDVLGKLIVYILLTVGAITFIAPWAWMVSASFQPIGEIFEWPPNWIPQTPTLANYRKFLAAEGFFRWVLNSGFLAIVVLVLQMFFNSLAAYTFAKRKFPGRDGLFLLMLGTLMIPGQLFLIPNYLILLRSPLFEAIIFSAWGGRNAGLVWGIISPYHSASGAFLHAPIQKGIPRLLRARMDGASSLHLLKVVMPFVVLFCCTSDFTFTFVWKTLLATDRHL